MTSDNDMWTANKQVTIRPDKWSDEAISLELINEDHLRKSWRNLMEWAESQVSVFRFQLPWLYFLTPDTRHLKPPQKLAIFTDKAIELW